jgi:hypothetical protein
MWSKKIECGSGIKEVDVQMQSILDHKIEQRAKKRDCSIKISWKMQSWLWRTNGCITVFRDYQ